MYCNRKVVGWEGSVTIQKNCIVTEGLGRQVFGLQYKVLYCGAGQAGRR